MGSPGGEAAAATSLEVWFDPICPWTYLGERRLAEALDHAGLASQFAVVWRSFELDPEAPRRPERTATQVMLESGSDPDALAGRWRRIHELAAAAGIVIDMDAARPVNSHDAHRLVHLARPAGAESVVVRRLFSAYHGDQANIADHAVLREIGVGAGLAAADVDGLLAGRQLSPEVRAEQAGAAQFGIRSVPTARVDERVIVPLFRPVEELAAALAATLPRPGVRETA